MSPQMEQQGQNWWIHLLAMAALPPAGPGDGSLRLSEGQWGAEGEARLAPFSASLSPLFLTGEKELTCVQQECRLDRAACCHPLSSSDRWSPSGCSDTCWEAALCAGGCRTGAAGLEILTLPPTAH